MRGSRHDARGVAGRLFYTRFGNVYRGCIEQTAGRRDYQQGFRIVVVVANVSFERV